MRNRHSKRSCASGRGGTGSSGTSAMCGIDRRGVRPSVGIISPRKSDSWSRHRLNGPFRASIFSGSPFPSTRPHGLG
jgi:hypothetical protein